MARSLKNIGSVAKPLAVAAVPALLISLLVLLSRSEASAVAALPDMISVPLSFVTAVATALGLSSLANWVASSLSGPLLPLTFFVASTLFFFPTVVVPVMGRSIVERLWPSYPRHLLRLGESENQVGATISDDRKLHLEREEEMRALMRFAGSPEKSSWLNVVGREGYGKSRLAFEWLGALDRQAWDVGRLPNTVVASNVASIHLRKRTAIVIDDYEAWDQNLLWQTVVAILQRPNTVRVLICGQVPVRLPATLAADVVDILQGRQGAAIRLKPLSDVALRTLNPSIDDTALKGAQGRPLYAILGNDLANEVKIRAARRASFASSPVEHRALAVAALLGPLRGELRDAFDISGVSIASLERLHEGVDRQILKTQVPAVAPRLFANEVFLAWADDQDMLSLQRFIEAAAELAPTALSYRLAQLWEYQVGHSDRDELMRVIQRTAASKNIDPDSEIKARYEMLFDEVSNQAYRVTEAWSTAFSSICESAADLRIRHPAHKHVFMWAPKLYVKMASDLNTHEASRYHLDQMKTIIGDPSNMVSRLELASSHERGQMIQGIALALDWMVFHEKKRISRGESSEAVEARRHLYGLTSRYPTAYNVDRLTKAMATSSSIGAAENLILADWLEEFQDHAKSAKGYGLALRDTITALHHHIPDGVDTSPYAIRLYRIVEHNFKDSPSPDDRQIYMMSALHLGWVFKTNGHLDQARAISSRVLDESLKDIQEDDAGVQASALWLAAAVLEPGDSVAASELAVRILEYPDLVSGEIKGANVANIAGATSSLIERVKVWPAVFSAEVTEGLIRSLARKVLADPSSWEAWRVLDLVQRVIEKKAVPIFEIDDVAWELVQVAKLSGVDRSAKAMLLRKLIHAYGEIGYPEGVRKGLSHMRNVMRGAERLLKDDNMAFGHWALACKCALSHSENDGYLAALGAAEVIATLKWLAQWVPENLDVQESASFYLATYVEQQSAGGNTTHA